ncbi:MAG: chemotaxis protein CheA [Bacteriovoracaceae bacterium]|nr:chemotaxis protein CheA [Bacteriovoracaceae bacterium]
MEDFEQELKMDFLEEAEDLLSHAESAFLRLEEEREDAELLNEIFRVAHNLKGTSKAVGFDQMAQLTHIAENLILKLKEGELQVTDAIVSGLLEFKDKVEEMIKGLLDDLDASFEIDSVTANLESLTSGQVSAEAEEVEPQASIEEERVLDNSLFDDSEDPFDEEVVSTEEFPDAAMFEESSEVAEESMVSDAALESLRELGLSEEELEGLGGTPAASADEEALSFQNVEKLPVVESKVEQTPVAEPKKEAKKESGQKDESIRVNLSRIDNINNIIGELVILQTVLSQRRYVNIKDELSNKSISMMGKLFKEVQEVAMSLRMLPLKGAFQKMNRIVRDTSKALGKDAKLVMVGEETEVDKTVLERISDPLVHIVRNAVDHGLESDEDRVASGKGKGVIQIKAFHEGSNLAIQITDDGKGIDHEVIRAKAVEKKIISANSTMTPDEIIQLIFHPGFSTKEQVTEVSGRGVGMDVVKTNIEALGGQVKVESKIGEGSSFKIMIPLTLAIIEGLVINSDGQKFVIPLSQVHELTQVNEADVEKFTGAAELFRLRGEVMPLFHINKKLGAKVEQKASNIVVVVKGLGRSFGVAVDDVLIQQQIVIKKLGEDLRGKQGIMGSAIMSDGMPSLILDLFELFKNDLKESKAHKEYKEGQAA